MKAKTFILITLNDEIQKARKEIRLIKKDIRVIEDMKAVMRNKSEKDILETVLGDTELKKAYETLLDQYNGKKESEQKEEFTRMVDKGILKEIEVDEQGKPILETNTSDNCKSEQSLDGENDSGRGSGIGTSGSDESVLSNL